jgi:hypothetical protein
LSLDRLVVTPKSGLERFRLETQDLGFDLLSFWRWSASDLLSNTTRGVLAEYLVARALGVPPDAVRSERAAHDLQTAEGIRVGVKSAAYLQSWQQRQLSQISFVAPRRRPWNDDDRPAERPARQVDVHVFALLAHQDKSTVDPMAVEQWSFFVVATNVLEQRTRSQYSITLPSLARLSGPPIPYHRLRDAVVAAARQQVPPPPPNP